MAFTLNGHLPDPDDENALSSYWNFGAQLRPHLVPGAGDADLRPYASPAIIRGKRAPAWRNPSWRANLERQDLPREVSSVTASGRPWELIGADLYYLCREQCSRRAWEIPGRILFSRAMPAPLWGMHGSRMA
jgi:hypothetical protein